MKPKFVALAGGALIVVGSIMPWATASAGVFSRTISGTDGDGVITLIAGVAVVLAALVAKEMPGKPGSTLAGLLSIAGGLVALNTFGNISKASGDLDVSVSIGYGLFLTLIGALLGVVGGFMRNPIQAGAPAGASTAPAAVAPVEPAAPSTADKLAELKRLLDQGLITESEYAEKRARLLEQM